MNSDTVQKTDADMQPEQGTDQYLTFCLAGEEYGVNILKVQEIRGWSEVTPMPNTPDCVLGVINLRGTVVPIIELRSHFGLPATDRGPTTVVIVVKAEDSEGVQRTVGMVVDAVSEVHNIMNTDIQPAPEIGDAAQRPAVAGLATMGERMIILLDVDELIVHGVLSLTGDKTAA